MSKMTVPNSQESYSLQSYLFFLIGQVQSQLGSVIVQFAIIWWIALEYRSPFLLGLATFAGFAPMILVIPVAGVLVDRWNRRIIIATMDFLQAIVTTLLVYLFWTDAVTIWHILIVLAFRALFQAFHIPATEAIIPILVPRDKLSRINGLRQFMIGGNRVIGPVMAVLLLNFWEIHEILLLDPLTFGLAVIPVLLIKIPTVKKSLTRKEKPSFKREFSDGLLFILQKPGLLPFLVVITVMNFCFQPLYVLLPLFVIQTHSGGIEDLAFLWALNQVGFLIGSTVMMTSKEFERKIAAIILAMLGMFVGFLLISLIPLGPNSFLYIGVGMFTIGFMLSLINTTALTLWQSVVPPDKLGRVTSVRRTIIWFAIPISAVLSGFLAEFFDIRLLFFTCGVLGLICLAYGWFMTRLPNAEKAFTPST